MTKLFFTLLLTGYAYSQTVEIYRFHDQTIVKSDTSVQITHFGKITQVDNLYLQGLLASGRVPVVAYLNMYALKEE